MGSLHIDLYSTMCASGRVVGKKRRVVGKGEGGRVVGKGKEEGVRVRVRGDEGTGKG